MCAKATATKLHVQPARGLWCTSQRAHMHRRITPDSDYGSGANVLSRRNAASCRVQAVGCEVNPLQFWQRENQHVTGPKQTDTRTVLLPCCRVAVRVSHFLQSAGVANCNRVFSGLSRQRLNFILWPGSALCIGAVEKLQTRAGSTPG